MTGTSKKLTAAVETYFDDLRKVRASGGATGERSSYPALSNLLNAVCAALKPKVFCVGELADRRGGSAQPLRKRYRREDIVQLAETDELHGRLSGSAAWALLRRAWEVFEDMRYERLAGLSNGHPHNLRRGRAYVRLMSRRQRAETLRVNRPGRCRIAGIGRRHPC